MNSSIILDAICSPGVVENPGMRRECSRSRNKRNVVNSEKTEDGGLA